jgi:hypothetical protein
MYIASLFRRPTALYARHISAEPAAPRTYTANGATVPHRIARGSTSVAASEVRSTKMTPHPPYFFAQMLRELQNHRAVNRQPPALPPANESFQQRLFWIFALTAFGPLVALMIVGLLLRDFALG